MNEEKKFGSAREAMEGMIMQGYEDIIMLDPTSVEYDKTLEAIKLAQIGLKKFVRMVIANCLNFC